MKKCKCNRKRKHIAYGSIRKWNWCPSCDASMINEINKKALRKKMKREIKKLLDDYFKKIKI